MTQIPPVPLGSRQERGLPRVRVRHEVLHEELAAVPRQAHPPTAAAAKQAEARGRRQEASRKVNCLNLQGDHSGWDDMDLGCSNILPR